MRRYRFGGRAGPLLAVVGLVALLAAPARADEGDCGGWLPWWKRLFVHRDPGRLYQGTGGHPHDFDSMGHPEEISKFAAPSETANYFGYYVGGGCAFQGGPPGPAEGTYGWDYAGLCCHCKRIVLNWCHRDQGGIGPYRIDGPHTPDIGPYIEKLKEGPGHKEEQGEEHHAEHGEEHHVEHAHAEPFNGKGKGKGKGDGHH